MNFKFTGGKKLLICTLCASIPLFCVRRTVYKQDSSTSNDIVPPVLKQHIEPFYPPEARAKGIQGSVQLSLFITQEGKVQMAEITGSSGYSILDQSAQDYAMTLVFTPAQRNSQPTPVWLSWTVNYSLILYKHPFEFESYVGRLQKLFADAERGTDQEKNKIFTEILDKHKQYINHIRQNPRSNIFNDLKILLSPQIFQQWQTFLTEWPLTFIVIQDLLKRFPGSEKAYDVKEMLIRLAEEDVKRVLVLTDEPSPRILKLRNEFFEALHEFLRKDYPEYLKGYLKEELGKYSN